MAPQRQKFLFFPPYFKLNLKTVIVITAVVFVSYKLIGYFIVGHTEIPPPTNYLDEKNHVSPQQEKARSGQTLDRSDVYNPQNKQHVEQLNAVWSWTGTQQYPADSVFVLMPFTNARNNVNLQTKFRTCVTSMSELSSAHIVLFVAGDTQSRGIAEDIVSSLKKKNVEAHHVDVEELGRRMRATLAALRQNYASNFTDSYYSRTLFFISPALHRITPPTLPRLIMLDADLLFRDDVRRLHDLFRDFRPSNLIGVAHENQPVYRHVLHAYRRSRPGTRAGDPPPDGFPGFNSGVLLLDLDRMRESRRYNALLDSDTVRALSEKYAYQGHLGDQDFYTLLGLENEDLFFVLPCGWNRQLCVWWRDNGYREVFDAYFACRGKISIYHGNCNTPLPEE